MGLDTVELVMTFESSFDLPLPDEEIVDLTTPRHVIDLVCEKLGAVEGEGFCAPMRAFHLFRRGAREALADPSRKVGLSEKVSSLRGKLKRREFREGFAAATGIPDCPPSDCLLFGSGSVRNVIEFLLAHHLHRLKKPDEPWTRSLVRTGVRYGVIYQIGIREFSDDDRFVEELRIE